MGNEPTTQQLEEIQRRLAEALAQAGVRGELELTENAAVLHLGAHQRRAPMGQLPFDWRTITEAERGRHIFNLQQQLTPRLRRSLPPRRQTWVGLSLIASVTALVSFALLRGIWQAKAPTGTPDAAAARGAKEGLRARRVCEATRSRVMRGGTVGPADVEGWVLELRLLRSGAAKPLAQTDGIQSLLAFQDPRAASVRVSWSDAPPQIRDNNSGQIVISEGRSPDYLDTQLRFSGDYLRSYFNPEERIHWIRLASALARRSAAIHGALYARCEHSQTHHIGAWFESQSAGTAANTLLYFMGVFVESPFLSPEILETRDKSADRLLRMLRSRTESLTKAELATWLGQDGGMVAGTEEGRITITFPFKDSNRASRASLRVARKLGIGGQR